MTNRSAGFHAPATSRKLWTTEGSARPERHSRSQKMKPEIKPTRISLMCCLSLDHMPHDEHGYDRRSHECHGRHCRARRQPRKSTNTVTRCASVSEGRSNANQQSRWNQNAKADRWCSDPIEAGNPMEDRGQK